VFRVRLNSIIWRDITDGQAVNFLLDNWLGSKMYLAEFVVNYPHDAVTWKVNKLIDHSCLDLKLYLSLLVQN